jgi:amino acid adenylation domain-containing protein
MSTSPGSCTTRTAFSDEWVSAMTEVVDDRAAVAAESDVFAVLSPAQQAYLMGGQRGLELQGPARYYLGCDVDPARLDGIDERLRRLARRNDVLRVAVRERLSLSVLPAEVADELAVEVRSVEDVRFEEENAAVRDGLTGERFAFDVWPHLELVAVRSSSRARLHLVYALWVMDAGSLDVFLAELIAEGAAVVPEPADESPARRDRRARDERFWRARAADLPGPAQMPLRPGWRQASGAVKHRMVALAPAVGQAIARLAQQHGVTPAMVYLAAYGFTLGRLGGGGAHAVTVWYSQRTEPPTPATVDNRGNTMPLAIPPTQEQPFADLARSVQARYLSQAMHSSLSGAQIVRLGDPSADPRRLPHPFAFTALEVDTVREARLGLRRRWDETELRVPQVLMDHQAVTDSDGTVRLGFDWRAEAFDRGFVEDLVDQHTAFLGELAGSADRWTRGPRPVGPGSPARPHPLPRGEALHQRVLRTVAALPDAPAVHDADGTLTYRELADRARALAHRLLDAGARPGDAVAIHLPRSGGQVVAVLGSLLAGCVYVPLDRGVPDGRLDAIARQAAVRFAVTDGEPSGDDRWRARGVLALGVPSAPGPSRPLPAVDPPTIAYIIFTSGSTGEPKGVVISHAAVLNTLEAINDLLGVEQGDSVLSVSSAGFDLSVYDMLGPLLRGASVVMLSEQTARRPAAWADLIRRHGVTLWNSAPALAALLAEEQAPVPSIRAFLLSGDWIPLTLPCELQGLAAGAQVLSLGGATEGSIWSIVHPIGAEDCDGRSIPYGRPLPGQDVLVLDAERRPCSDWQIGDIYIAGAGVAEGYVDDAERTAAAFFDDRTAGWIYRTGDRGRRHPGGVVEFLGRIDTQVKLNGHRVELGEVEKVLERFDEVQRCAACVRGEGRRAGIVAFVSLSPDVCADWRERAQAALEHALPRYMVPRSIVALDALPLTGNGKVDRRRLEALPVEGAVETRPSSLETRDRESQAAATCWQEVLGPAAAPDASFFEAGGSSYDAIRLLSMLHRRFGHEVEFGDFIAEPTLSGLAALCRGAGQGEASSIWALRLRSSERPDVRVVLFPPVGGGVSCYSAPARELSIEADVHVVGFDGPVADLTAGPGALPALAQRCLEQLPQAAWAADGVPLVLAGWSFGGALAVEAARDLDGRVARVVVVDTPVAAGSRAGGNASEAALLEGFANDVGATSGVATDPAQVMGDPILARRFAVYRQNMAALAAWRPDALDVPVAELRAAESPAEPDPRAWGRVAPVADAMELSGDHFAVFDGDNLQRLARAIEEAVR